MKFIRVAFGLLAAVAATSTLAAEKVYKWKDANGIVHFSDSPPPKGTEFNNVRIVNQSAAITQQPATAPTGDAPTQTEKPIADDASNAARCRNAQNRVALLGSPSPVTIQRDGKIVEMTEADRAAELAIARTTVTSLCAPAEGAGQ